LVQIPLQLIYSLFVGNKKAYIEWFNGRWVRRYSSITPHKIKQHTEHKIAIGSYPIYQKDGKEYCKWICIDVDSHKRVPKHIRDRIRTDFPKTWKLEIIKITRTYRKLIDQDIKKIQYKFALEVAMYSSEYFKTRKNCVFMEDSGGGYHIWVLLEDNTLLEDAGKYIEMIKPKLIKKYREYIENGEDPEFYPKQYTLSHLDEKCGNGVRLPFGKNIGKDYSTKIICGLINKAEKLNIINITQYYTGPDIMSLSPGVSRRDEWEEYKPQEIDDKLFFWFSFPRIRPCFKKLMDGTTQCYDTHGHRMRMAMCHECNFYRMPKELVINSYHNQFDYDEAYSRVQVDSVLTSTALRDPRYSCRKIKELGYCHEFKGCNYKFGKR